jgi:hypothetical protein
MQEFKFRRAALQGKYARTANTVEFSAKIWDNDRLVHPSEFYDWKPTDE